MHLVGKCINARCFFSGDFDKILMETEKLSDNLRATEYGIVSSVDRVIAFIYNQSSNSTFLNVGDRLDPPEKNIDFGFLVDRLAYCSYASIIISKLWCHENETGSLYFGSLLKRYLSCI